MAWHSINEAQLLTGKSRRTLYRDMAGGRLSWTMAHDGARKLETAELMRVYGPLLAGSATTQPEEAHDGTAHGTIDLTAIMAELQSLRAEIVELKSAMLLLEHIPPVPTEQSISLPWWKRAFLKT